MRILNDVERKELLNILDGARSDAIGAFVTDTMSIQEVLINEALPSFAGEWVWHGKCLQADCDWSSMLGGGTEGYMVEEVEEHAAEHVDVDLPHIATLALKDLTAAWHADQCGCVDYPASCVSYPDGIPEPTFGPVQVMAAAGRWLSLEWTENQRAHREESDRLHASARKTHDRLLGIQDKITVQLRAGANPFGLLSDVRHELSALAPF